MGFRPQTTGAFFLPPKRMMRGLGQHPIFNNYIYYFLKSIDPTPPPDPIERMIKKATVKSVKFVAPMTGQPVSIEHSIDFNKWWVESMA